MVDQAGNAARLHVGGASPYDVVVGDVVLGELPAMLGTAAQRIALIHPEALPGLAARVATQLSDYDVLHIELPEGEIAKTGAVAIAAWEQLGEAGFTRSDAVVTVGGGATTDMGGFIAATWLRGVRVVHVPTSLLGMVDAAVGGKTGMNTTAGKNLVGAFHEPAGVICDLTTLGSLPEPELIAGLAEVIKCGFIADPEILRIVEESPENALEPRSSQLRDLVERAIRVKIDVVVDDLRETGGHDGHPGREALNYGHTLAHAIEKATGYRVRHGEAVAIGMVYVAEVARRLGRIDDATADRHAAVLRLVGLPTHIEGLDFDDLMATMRVDKKARGSQLRFVLLDGIGRPVIVADPDVEVLRSAYDVIAGVA